MLALRTPGHTWLSLGFPLDPKARAGAGCGNAAPVSPEGSDGGMGSAQLLQRLYLSGR